MVNQCNTETEYNKIIINYNSNNNNETMGT
jgi:hypothetical protein